jgi:hypothetical protein
MPPGVPPTGAFFRQIWRGSSAWCRPPTLCFEVNQLRLVERGARARTPDWNWSSISSKIVTWSAGLESIGGGPENGMRTAIGSPELDPMSSTTRIQRARTCWLHVWGICSLTLRDDETGSILVTPKHPGAGESARAQESGLWRRGQHRSPEWRRIRFPKQRELGLSRRQSAASCSGASRPWVPRSASRRARGFPRCSRAPR